MLFIAPVPVWSAKKPVIVKDPAAGTKKTEKLAAADRTAESRYSNEEFGFTFSYPESWVVLPGAIPEIQVRVANQEERPVAECALIVKRFPKAENAKQRDIDQIFSTPPTTAELEEVLGEGGNAVKVTSARSGRLHKRPAHIGRVHYKIDTDAYASGLVVMTATPGLTWTLSCSGLGETPAVAEKNFQFWQNAVNTLVTSFTFR